MRRPAAHDIGVLAATAALWGSGFVAIKVALRDLPPLTVAAARVGIAAAALALFLGLRGARLPRTSRAWLAAAGVGLIGFGLPFALVSWAETRLGAAQAGMLFAAGPLVGMVVSHLLSRDDRLAAAKLAGLFIGFAGVAWLVLGTQSEAAAAATTGGAQWSWMARLAVPAASACYAVGGNLVRRIEDVRPDVITTIALTTATAALVPLSALVERPWGLAAGGAELGALLYLGLVPTALAYVIRFRQAVAFGYTFVSFAGYLVPVFAMIWGVWLLGDALEPRALVALATVLAGIWISRRPVRGAAPSLGRSA